MVASGLYFWQQVVPDGRKFGKQYAYVGEMGFVDKRESRVDSNGENRTWTMNKRFFRGKSRNKWDGYGGCGALSWRCTKHA